MPESPTPRAAAPSPPFPAATVVLVRPSRARREVLLLRRPPTSAFAPDAWVFPGGRVDEADRRFDHASLAEGPTPQQWARELGIEDAAEAAAYAVAAAREAWEETGYLLTEDSAPPPGGRRARAAQLRDATTLQEYLTSIGRRLATRRLRYVAHWITPDWLPRRFDTRFFVCEVDQRLRCELLGEELVEFRWLTPAAALEAADRGEMSMLPPTVDTLLRIDRGEL